MKKASHGEARRGMGLLHRIRNDRIKPNTEVTGVFSPVADELTILTQPALLKFTGGAMGRGTPIRNFLSQLLD